MAVEQAVAIGVPHQRIGGVGPEHLDAIAQAVAVGVSDVDICTRRQLVGINEAVPVSVYAIIHGVGGIGTVHQRLHPVLDAAAVAVGQGGARLALVHGAVAVEIFPGDAHAHHLAAAVTQAVAVAVGIRGVGAAVGPPLYAVADPVAVGVRAVGIRLASVHHAVGVGVLPGEADALHSRGAVAEQIAVSIRAQRRRGVIADDLQRIRQAVAVGVPPGRISAQGPLHRIEDPVPVSVHAIIGAVERIGAVDVALSAVPDAAAVAVEAQRVRLAWIHRAVGVGVLGPVAEAVIVAVAVERIAAVGAPPLLAIAEAVVIAVGPPGIRLPSVHHAVGVHVLSGHAQPRHGAGAIA